MPFIVQHYSAEQRLRLEVTPGITGIWQLSPDRIDQIHENLQYDFYYIQNRCLSLDLAILVETGFNAFGQAFAAFCRGEELPQGNQSEEEQTR